MGDKAEYRVPFVDYLVALKTREDRAALAKLRRGAGKEPGAAPEMFPYIAPWLGGDDTGLREARFYLVASLFALHPEHSDGMGSLGATFRSVAGKDEGGGAERRFVALLNSHPEDLSPHLRHALSLAAAKGVAVNYHRLFRDLGAWAAEARYVQRAWAQDFWGKTRALETETSNPDTKE